MPKVEKFARIIVKIDTNTGNIPTIPGSNDHTILPAWSTTDIYTGEFFLNSYDKKLFMRVDDTTIKEIAFYEDIIFPSSGSTGSSGSAGSSGTSGINGKSGTSGINGSSGASGTSGTSGKNGSPGTSGTSGLDGNANFNTDDNFYYDTSSYSLYSQNINISSGITYTASGYGTGKTLFSNETGELFYDDISVKLLSVTVSASTFVTGDKYYNSADNLIYTAISNTTWDSGRLPIVGLIYVYDGKNYMYDRNSLEKISIIKTSSLIELNTGNIEPDLTYDIIQYVLNSGITNQILDDMISYPTYSCVKIIEVVNNSTYTIQIVVNTDSVVVDDITYRKINLKESTISLIDQKRVEFNLLFKKINNNLFEISITNIIEY